MNYPHGVWLNLYLLPGKKVTRAREKQDSRSSDRPGIYANAQMDGGLPEKTCLIEKAGSPTLNWLWKSRTCQQKHMAIF
jgi:hypothetical protein